MKINLTRQTPWHSRQYPPEFNDQFKRAIRRRDGLRCSICSKKCRLDVHHIDYTYRTVPENCISLCRTCHDMVHRSGTLGKLKWRLKLANLALKRKSRFQLS